MIKGVMCKIILPLDVGDVLRMYGKTTQQRDSVIVGYQTIAFSWTTSSEGVYNIAILLIFSELFLL